MARIRTIKPGFFKHGELFDAEVESKLPLRVAYAGLWTVADREGRFKWRPRDIKTDVLPYDNVSMEEVLTALERFAFIQSYEVDGKKYAWIPAFKEHQHVNVREPASDIPEPPKNKNARAKRVPAPVPNGEVKEGKGKEGDISFDAFWNAYPRKEAKGDAIRAFAKARETTPAETLIAGALAYAALRSGQDPKFTKLPATWLNKLCWTDDNLGGFDPASMPSPERLAELKDSTDRIMKRGKYAPGVQ